MEERAIVPRETGEGAVEAVDVAYMPDAPEEPHAGPGPLAIVLRRWRLAAAAAFLLCAIGLPAIWFGIEPHYTATSAIEIVPIIPRIVFQTDADKVPLYGSYVGTQAALITSNRIIYPLLEDPAVRDLAYVKAAAHPAAALRDDLEARTQRGSQLLLVSMTGKDPEAITTIVNAAVRVYMRIEGSNEATSEDEKLRTLERERDTASEKLRSLYDSLHELGQEYGTTDLEGRQDVVIALIQSLQEELTRIKLSRIGLAAQAQFLEDKEATASRPANLIRLRKQYVNADPLVSALTSRITELEQQYELTKTKFRDENVPELLSLRRLTESLRSKLEDSHQKLEEEFEDVMAQEMDQSRTESAEDLKDRLALLESQEEQVKAMLDQQDLSALNVGRKSLAIRKLEEEIAFTRDLYQTVRQRIQVLQVERQRPARVRVAYEAEAPAAPSRDKRRKYCVVLVMGAGLFGCAFVVLLHQMTPRLETPSDVEAQHGMRVLGTTPRFEDLDRETVRSSDLLADYRTIRVNLMLAGTNHRARALVITSAKARDGKTTFAINLATSLAMAGKRVLLVDGDLHKPEIARYLAIDDTRGLPEVLSGECRLEDVVKPTSVETLSVLPGRKPRDLRDELLENGNLEVLLVALKERYDEIIIDTPPVLAMPDAKVWARLSDAVLLVARSGRTASAELTEANARMKQAAKNVVGVVLTGVRVQDSYDQYHRRYTQENEVEPSPEGDGKFFILRSNGRSENGDASGNA